MKKIIQTRSKVNQLKKLVYNKLPFDRKLPNNNLFILGCQRSGTTLISRVFDNIIYTKVFGEYNEFANPPKGFRPLRLKDLAATNAGLNLYSQRFKVMKPIVDSQIANQLLSRVDSSSVLWVYRNFKDVALSNIKKFGDNHGGYAHIEAILKANEDDWRGQNISDETRNIITTLAQNKLSAIEASCLFWYARNKLYFEQGLDKSTAVTIWKYESFVKTPKTLLDNLLIKLGYPISGFKTTQMVSDSSIDRAINIEISAEIETLCSNLLAQLDNAFEKQQT